MRYSLLAGLAFTLCAGKLSAQNVTMRLDFATGEDNASASQLSKLPAIRAFTDSVSAYFNDELRQHGPPNLVRDQATNTRQNFRVVIQPLPMMTAANTPTGVTVYAIVVFRAPGALGVSWNYMDSTVGYTSSAASAATTILNFFVSELR